MRAVLQRVTSAEVKVDGETVGQISSPGLLALIGVTHDDTPATARAMADKIAGLRILDGEVSALSVGAPILVVSQFTLYADLSKGRRPSWGGAAPGAVAEPLVDEVIAALRETGLGVETGRFGADMQVSLVNDGPVTIIIEI